MELTGKDAAPRRGPRTPAAGFALAMPRMIASLKIDDAVATMLAIVWLA